MRTEPMGFAAPDMPQVLVRSIGKGVPGAGLMLSSYSAAIRN